MNNILATDVLKELKSRCRRLKVAFLALLTVSAATISVLLTHRGRPHED